jgi:DNA processing protein
VEDSLRFYLTLNHIGISARKVKNLVENKIDTLDKIKNLSASLLEKLKISEKQKDNIFSDKLKIKLENDLKWLNQSNENHIIHPKSPSFPPNLLQISDTPIVLYAIGNIELLSRQQIAIVGSRVCSTIAQQNAQNFAKCLVQSGVIVTSGMAKGIDSFAHIGALAGAIESKSTNSTIGVLGTGIDKIYPSENKNLYQNIAKNGVLVSEFALGTQPIHYNFPKRNRIISGLSLGVLVVEAGVKSGSLITAKIALEQNKEVFAIPGSIHNPVAKGCNHLIKQGAKLTENIEDILEELPFFFVGNTKTEEKKENPALKNLTQVQNTILENLGEEPLDIDSISIATQINTQTLMVEMLNLELLEIISSNGNKYHRIAW